MAAALVALAVHAPGAEPAYLTANEVRDLITGNTVESRTEEGATFRVYFDASGQRVGLGPDGEQTQRWRILEDGSHCVMTGTGEDCARVGRTEQGGYARYREGRAVVRWLQILPGKALGPPTSPGVYMRQLGTDKYSLLLVDASTITESQAHARAAATANDVCKALVPEMGLFRFESTEKVGGGEGVGRGTFRFTQEFSCVTGVRAAPTAPTERRPALQSAEESQRVQAQIKAISEAWLQQVATGLLDEAYAQIVPESMGVDERAWKDMKRSFRAMAGEPVQLTIWRITVYDNPPGASAPGLYVAADYHNEYSKLALQCGYLMWHRPAAGSFRIMREETGNITAQELKSIPAAELTAIKRKFHCAP